MNKELPENTIDKAIEEALQMHESGFSVPEILSKFPEEKEVLKEIFSVTSVLDKSDVHITPPKKILKAIISDINTGATTPTKKKSLLILSPFTIFANVQKRSLVFAIILFALFSVTYPGELRPWANTDGSQSNILAIAQAADNITHSIDFGNGSTTAYTEQIELETILLPSIHNQVDTDRYFYIAQAQQ